MVDVPAGLEKLIFDATAPTNAAPNNAAIEALCGLLDGNAAYCLVAIRILGKRIQNQVEHVALQTFDVVDRCMKNCGPSFQSEVGKFRFLNEMIKLVSPKYLGGRTSPVVRSRVLHLLNKWSLDYPREPKIKEAYDMLKKQGVVKEDVESDVESIVPTSLSKPKPSVFEDSERTRVLQKLLQSKNPHDLQAANRLIKTMVREDERRVEIQRRLTIHVELVNSNARLLSEMLDSYRQGQTSEEEMELIKEVYESCERLRPMVFEMASDTQENEEVMSEILNASDELGRAMDKYKAVIKPEVSLTEALRTASLLDFSSPAEETANSGMSLEERLNASGTHESSTDSRQSGVELLGDVFGPLSPADVAPSSSSSSSSSILQPVSVQPTKMKRDVANQPQLQKPSKQKAFEDLDALSESLLKENLPCVSEHTFPRSSAKVPMNLLGKSQHEVCVAASEEAAPSQVSQSSVEAAGDSQPSALDLYYLMGDMTKLPNVSSISDLFGDDSMVDLSDDTSSRSPIPPPFEPSTNDCSHRDALAASSQDHNDISKAKPNDATPASNWPTIGDTNDAALGISANSTNTGTSDANEASSFYNTAKGTPSSVPQTFANSVAGSTGESKGADTNMLSDIKVSLQDIRPGPNPPMEIVQDKNGVSVTLHFAADAPQPDVSVIVVTSINKNTSPITNYLFRAVVPKSCRLRLLPASGAELPAFNPFVPPSAVTQIMLIQNKNKDPITLKFMISFTMDGETFTEIGETQKLP